MIERFKKLSQHQKFVVVMMALLVGTFLGAILTADRKPEGASSRSEQVATAGTTENPANSEPPEAIKVVKNSKWVKFEDVDELRGTKNKYASILSLNSARFDFPYCCDSKLTILVRRTSQYGEDVIFQISDGQFQCGIYDCSGMISFDGKPEKLTLSSAESGDPKVLFAKYPKPIINKLNSAELTIVELPFFQEGRRQFKFETHGLEWN